MPPRPNNFDVIVIGGGHAGLEAAWASANLGARTALVTLDPSKIGVMSCNPAIGGLAKGQMVREIDALGGLMGLAADATGIMFKVLNTSRGVAVRGPRCQCDRHAYAHFTRNMIRSRDEITIIEGAAEMFHVEHPDPQDPMFHVEHDRATDPSSGQCPPRITAVTLADGRTLHANAIVLTTGTFMRGLMHQGASRTEGGRSGEAPANAISNELRRLGFELARLKTGTPPRLLRASIDWESLPIQGGDEPPIPFSELTRHALGPAAPFPRLEQVECRVTHTVASAHELIRANLDRAPMFNGQVESAGPRYCPSIEDKVVRFADRNEHHVFLEPESHESDWVYCNGIATSLPVDVQEALVRSMPGCANAEIIQHGYAVEYDMVRPHQIDAACQAKRIRGLFLAGQINGTSGYEEAGGQGLLAGLNAARAARGLEPVALGRDAAYIGVMMDDLVTKTPTEPYRMFTSRAEHRLLLRADNACDRLTPLGRAWGLVDDERWTLFERRREALASLNSAIDAAPMREGVEFARRVRSPRYTEDDLLRDLGVDGAALPVGVAETVLAERQYEGYIKRLRSEAARHAESERRRIPEGFDYADVIGLRAEAAERLARFRPTTIGQASRLEGVNPSDLTLLLVAIERARRAAQAASASGAGAPSAPSTSALASPASAPPSS